LAKLEYKTINANDNKKSFIPPKYKAKYLNKNTIPKIANR
jgi:hypothetical protein